MKRKERFLLVLLILLLGNTLLLAQGRRTITGVVTDNNGSPVPAATVTVEGTTTSSVTDDAGRFSIVVEKANAVLVFSSVSFGTKSVPVGSSNTLNVTLEQSATDLGEVVITTALGIKRQAKSLGYAVQELKGGTLADAKETNLANALTGKVAGLQVVRSSNGAGGSSKIVLRGNNSLTGDNQPLIVVDGIPIDNFTGTTENGYWSAGFDRGNGLGDISADDIESMTVLKGPSAAALYGSRAGNGVILVTTKSGRKTQGLGITFSTTQGVEDIFIKPELQNSFGQGTDGIFDPTSQQSWGPKAEGQNVTKWDGTQDALNIHNNVDNFLRKGTTQSYNLSFQQQFGGTAVYSSISRWNDRSIIPANKLERTNITTRATSRFGKNDRFTTDFKFSYNNTTGFNRPINGRDVSNVYVLYTLPRSLDIRDFSAGTNEFGSMLWYPGSPGWQNNPYWNSKYNLNQDSRDRFIMNGSLKYAFSSWLDAEVKAGADMYTTNTQRKVYAGSARANEYSEGKQTFRETNYSVLVSAHKENVVGKFGGVVTAGGNLMEQKSSYIGIGTGPLEVPNVFSLTNGQGAPSIGQSYMHKKINSIYGTVGINYDGYIYLDATFRNDWSSALIEENRSYFYPSVNFAVVVTDMMEKLGVNTPGWMNYLKLRASHASVGNDLAPYQLFNGYEIRKDPLNNTIAIRNSLLKDPNVRSELIKSLEFGAEARFLKNRIGIDFTWYKSNATRQLIAIPMDPMSGYTSQMVNAGNIQNKGIELVVDFRVLTKPNSLNWNITANYSKNENKVIDIAADKGVNEYQLGGFDDLFIRATSGSLYGDIYGTRFLRVEDESSPYFGQMILSAQGLPQRDSRIVRLGNQQAKGLLGITNTFSYKGLTFSFLIDGRFGGEIFSASNVGLQAFGTAAVTAPGGERNDFVVDGVVLDGGGNPVKNTVAVTQQQYWRTVSTLNNLGVGEAYLYDATNIRLRNVQLAYALPKSLFAKTPIQNARVALSCNNVWMLKSHLNGIDPESVFATGSNAVGFENGAFPTMRSFLFSLSLGF
jgi:TonB-linked SusC/RagA family outer membrane protein